MFIFTKSFRSTLYADAVKSTHVMHRTANPCHSFSFSTPNARSYHDPVKMVICLFAWSFSTAHTPETRNSFQVFRKYLASILFCEILAAAATVPRCLYAATNTVNSCREEFSFWIWMSSVLCPILDILDHLPCTALRCFWIGGGIKCPWIQSPVYCSARSKFCG